MQDIPKSSAASCWCIFGSTQRNACPRQWQPQVCLMLTQSNFAAREEGKSCRHLWGPLGVSSFHLKGRYGQLRFTFFQFFSFLTCPFFIYLILFYLPNSAQFLLLPSPPNFYYSLLRYFPYCVPRTPHTHNIFKQQIESQSKLKRGFHSH